MSRCCLGLGGNVGDVAQTFACAAAELEEHAGAILAVSHTYRTAAVGKSAGNAYLNAAAVLETDLPPAELLDQLHQTEDHLGRTRDVRWGPRTLDLDLLLYADIVIHNDRVDVPHPGCLYRRFVLDPLSEIAGDWRHPETGLTVDEMRACLLLRPLPIVLGGGTRSGRTWIMQEIARRFPEVEVVEGEPPSTNGGQAVVSWLDVQRTGGHKPVGDDGGPSHLVNLDASGLEDLTTAVSVVQAMVDEPVRAGSIPWR